MPTTIQIPSWLLDGGLVFVGLSSLFMCGLYLRKSFIKRHDGTGDRRHRSRRGHADMSPSRQTYEELDKMCQGWKQQEKHERLKKEQEKHERLKKEQEEAKLNLLLPEPWKLLFDFLKGHENSTREVVILAATIFKRDVLKRREQGFCPSSVECYVEKFDKIGRGRYDIEVPFISPAGLDALLRVSYFNLPDKGNCHPEVTDLFREYVRFPQGDIK